MNANRGMLIAIPVILAVVLLLTYLQVFQYPVLLAAIFVLYIVVSLFNKRKFKRQAEARQAPPKRTEK